RHCTGKGTRRYDRCPFRFLMSSAVDQQLNLSQSNLTPPQICSLNFRGTSGMYENIYGHRIAKDTPLPFSLPEWIALAPFEEYLGMHIEEAGNGKAVLSMPFRAAHCQGAGLMHGGAVT